MTAHATITSAGIGTYTAGKVILALLAMAGVATEATDIESIWQGGQFNADAYINNVMVFSRDLGLALKGMIASAGAGATTLTIERSIWNKWKEYCEDEYGTTVGSTTSIGTVETEYKTWGIGSKIQIGYFAHVPNYPIDRQGTYNIDVVSDEVIIFLKQTYYNNVLGFNQFYIVPKTYHGNNDQSYISMSVDTVLGDAPTNSYSVENIGNNLGYMRTLFIGFGGNSTLFDSFVYPKGIYLIPNNVSDVKSYISTRVSNYRSTGIFSDEESIDAYPVNGVGEEAATTTGQDVIGFDNTATQEEGKDVVIEGPLDVALPASAEMEELLKQLAEQQITYQEFVQALALQAVDTKTETKAQVEAKQEAITVNPSNGLYTVSLDDLFPFCIPFDLYDMLNCLKAEPEAPEVEISLPIGYDGNSFTWEEYTISLEAFDTVAQVGRIFWYILFCIGLMLLTRKLIEG